VKEPEAIVKHRGDEVLIALPLAGCPAGIGVGAAAEGLDANARFDPEVAGERERSFAEQAARVVVVADEQTVVAVEAEAATVVARGRGRRSVPTAIAVEHHRYPLLRPIRDLVTGSGHVVELREIGRASCRERV